MSCEDESLMKDVRGVLIGNGMVIGVGLVVWCDARLISDMEIGFEQVN